MSLHPLLGIAVFIGPERTNRDAIDWIGVADSFSPPQVGPVSGAADQDQQAARGGVPGPHLPAQPGVPGGQAVEGEPGQGQPEGQSLDRETRRLMDFQYETIVPLHLLLPPPSFNFERRPIR